MVSLKDYLGEEKYNELKSKLRKAGGSYDRVAYVITASSIEKYKVSEDVKFGDNVGLEGRVMAVGKAKADKEEVGKKNQYGYVDAVNRILSYLSMQNLLDRAEHGVWIDEENGVRLFIAYVPENIRFRVNDVGKVSFSATVEENIAPSGWISIHVDPKEMRLEVLNEEMLAGKYVIVIGRTWNSTADNGKEYVHAMAYGLLITE